MVVKVVRAANLVVRLNRNKKMKMRVPVDEGVVVVVEV